MLYYTIIHLVIYYTILHISYNILYYNIILPSHCFMFGRVLSIDPEE